MKLLLFALAAVPCSLLVSPAVEADAQCLKEPPPIFVMTDKDYYNNFPMEIIDDELIYWDTIVVISGTVRNDIIDEANFENKVLIEIYAPNSTLVFSDYTSLDVNNGSFVYNYPLWLEEYYDSEKARLWNEYTIKTSYGQQQTDFTFVISGATPNGIGPLDISVPRISIVMGQNIISHEIGAGQQVQISMETMSNERRNLEGTPFVLLLEIRDEAGVTQYLALQSSLIKPGCSNEAGFSWMTYQEGNYSIRAFAISEWHNPRVLSMVSSTEVLVT